MLGLIVNVHDHLLPLQSPWRTREVQRDQRPIFWLASGMPVFEVWLYHDRHCRWFCHSTSYDPVLASYGVIFYFDLGQLKAWLAYLDQAL